MTVLAVVGAVAVVFVVLPALYIALDLACERIARALWDAVRGEPPR